MGAFQDTPSFTKLPEQLRTGGVGGFLRFHPKAVVLETRGRNPEAQDLPPYHVPLPSDTGCALLHPSSGWLSRAPASSSREGPFIHPFFIQQAPALCRDDPTSSLIQEVTSMSPDARPMAWGLIGAPIKYESCCDQISGEACFSLVLKTNPLWGVKAFEGAYSLTCLARSLSCDRI